MALWQICNVRCPRRLARGHRARAQELRQQAVHALSHICRCPCGRLLAPQFGTKGAQGRHRHAHPCPARALPPPAARRPSFERRSGTHHH